MFDWYDFPLMFRAGAAFAAVATAIGLWADAVRNHIAWDV